MCHCEVISIESFGGALLYSVVAFLLLPLTLHISIWFAKASKAVSYWFLTDHYSKQKDAARGKLLGSSGAANSAHVRNDSVSDNAPAAQAAIVHSLNNPYADSQV